MTAIAVGVLVAITLSLIATWIDNDDNNWKGHA